MRPETAQRLAEICHSGQRDGHNTPYVDHVSAVARTLTHPDERVVAWLHDTVEDGHTTIGTLRAHGLTQVQAQALALVTRDKTSGVTYRQWITLIACAEGPAGRLARAVKRADVLHHLSRPQPAGRESMRGQRYEPALEHLEAAMRDRGELPAA